MHNLILRIEGDDFDPEFREELFEGGQEGLESFSDVEDFDDPTEDADLRQARRALQTDGTRFRKLVMKQLFDSPYSTAVHCATLAANMGVHARGHGQGQSSDCGCGCGRGYNHGHGCGGRCLHAS